MPATFQLPSNRSFTMIEMLVVMVILVLLVGILTPAIVNGRERARRTRCLNNLRQIGLGLRQYALDQEVGAFSEAGAGTTVSPHFQQMSGYVGDSGELFACSSDAGKVATNSAAVMTDANVSYCYVRGLKDQDFAEVPIVFDRESAGAVDLASLGEIGDGFWPVYSPHKLDGGNVLFVDGHVKFLDRFPVVSGSVTNRLIASPD